MMDAILIIFVVAMLAWETNKVFRKKDRPRTGLFGMLILTVVVLVIASGLHWNGTLPLPLWWFVAVWTAALLGIYTARIFAVVQKGRAESETLS